MEFKTTDIVLASTLRINNYQMIRIDIKGSKGTFVFKNVDDKIVDKFNLGQCLVEPTNLNAIIKQLTTSVRRMSKN